MHRNVWLSLLFLGATFDATTTYFVLQCGYGEFNPVAAWLIDALGAVPGLVVVAAGSIAAGFMLLASRHVVPRAMGVAYAATRWIPGVHNALLLHGVALNPYYTLIVQYIAMLYVYLYFIAKSCRGGSRKASLTYTNSLHTPLSASA